MTLYRPAPAVERIATDIRGTHFPHLAGAQLVFLFVDPPPTKSRRVAWGRTSVITGRAAYLLALPGLDPEDRNTAQDGADHALFVVEVAELVWNHLEQGHRRALVDHLLSACWLEENRHGEIRLSLRAPDVAEYGAVVARHGMWRPELVAFGELVEQLSLADHWDRPPRVLETADA